MSVESFRVFQWVKPRGNAFNFRAYPVTRWHVTGEEGSEILVGVEFFDGSTSHYINRADCILYKATSRFSTLFNKPGDVNLLPKPFKIDRRI